LISDITIIVVITEREREKERKKRREMERRNVKCSTTSRGEDDELTTVKNRQRRRRRRSRSREVTAWEYPLFVIVLGFCVPIASGAILVFTALRIAATLRRRRSRCRTGRHQAGRRRADRETPANVDRPYVRHATRHSRTDRPGTRFTKHLTIYRKIILSLS